MKVSVPHTVEIDLNDLATAVVDSQGQEFTDLMTSLTNARQKKSQSYLFDDVGPAKFWRERARLLGDLSRTRRPGFYPSTRVD